jgi:DNA-binding NarL/FixJ family response regulator
VVVVAEVRLYREGLVNGLASRAGLTVLGAAGDRDGAVALVAAVQPDVVILDMARGDGLDLSHRVREAAPAARILALAIDESEGDILACAQAGVAGYVTCQGSMDDLVEAIGRCTRGEMLCSPRVTAMLFRRLGAIGAGLDEGPGAASLTPREVQIAGLIEAGRSNKEIALHLGIELATVKNHVHNILDKLGVTTRAEASARLRGRFERTAGEGPRGAHGSLAADVRGPGRRPSPGRTI